MQTHRTPAVKAALDKLPADQLEAYKEFNRATIALYAAAAAVESLNRKVAGLKIGLNEITQALAEAESDLQAAREKAEACKLAASVAEKDASIAIAAVTDAEAAADAELAASNG